LTIAVYPGSFDPITNGHLDIVTRAARFFDKIIIGVFERSNKHLIFSIEERVDLAKRSVANLPNVEVKSFSRLTVDFAKQEKAQVMIRGLRMNADFEKEFEMAMMNRKLSPELDLLCFMASQEYQFLSSSLLKEVARLNGNINDLVPGHVAEALRRKVHSKM
jgi:pantetheine-phosphate adenylyltransferase